MSVSETTGVLLTGVYGSGKSSVAEEIAAILETREVRYAALDLDWLWWFDCGDDGVDRHTVLHDNLKALVGNYLAVGVQHFVMAWAARDLPALETVTSACPFSVRVVRLEAPPDVIRARLRAEVTSQRVNDDLEVAEEWMAGQIARDVGEVEIRSDRSIRLVANEVLEWLEWT